ncbi:MAG: hypothetical protein ACOCYU_00205 [Brevefilum sp.]
MVNLQGKNKKNALKNFWSTLISPKYLRIIEILIAFITSAIIGFMFATYAQGGPNSSDLTYYMNIGLNGLKETFVLNRYFHIFLQQIFIELASYPMEGYHMFWGFLMGLNTFMIFISARKALVKSNFLHGILAVLIFFSISIIGDISGVIVVDLTAMTMMTALLTVYILSANKEHANPWIIGSFGVLLFLAFKTKETTLPAWVLLIGMGWIDKESFKIKNFLKNMIWVAGGVLVGAVIFAILNWIFLEDPLFGFRPREWREFSQTYVSYSSNVLATLNALGDGNLDNWYEGYWFEYTLMPFLFFLIGGVKLGRKVSIPRKVLWLVPLALIVFLIISINNRIGYLPRFGMPVLGILSILAPQFIDLRIPESKAARKKFFAFLAAGLALVVGIRLVMQLVIPAQNYHLGSVVTLVYYPLLITLLLASLFMFRDNALWNLINFLILFSLVISPISSNYRLMFVQRPNQDIYEQVVFVFSEYEDIIDYEPDMRFYAVDTVFTKSVLRIGKNIDELVALFNVYFDARATRENFVYAEEPQDVADDILAEEYDYVLMASENWRAVKRNGEKLNQVLERYQPHENSTGIFVMLTLR